MGPEPSDADRAECFPEATAGRSAPGTAVDGARAFTDRFECADLGPVLLAHCGFTAVDSWRTPALPPRDDPERYYLMWVTGGSARFTRADRTSTVGRGDWLLFDSSHPYEFTGTGDRPFRTTTLHVPRGAFPLPARRLDGLLGRRLPGDRGLGAVLGGFLRDAGAESGACGSADLERLGSAALDLSAAFLARRLDARPPLPRTVRADALLRRIDAFIDLNLGDPRLTPGSIAAAHDMSPRALYLLFERRTETVAARVRRRRLEHCRDDLLRAGPQERPLWAIAAHRGFTDVGVFSRAFRARYGMSPRDYRRAHGTPGPDPTG
ncbi:helix-turn-helix domain-containing protein [Streptomyces uncialis]|uniref:AraC-like ligand-binding domain-containing protein n=1 Tax=Streptomyces uncialis TaxID=1048205 RepID=UPI0037934059